jgi:hypothetical protein
MRLIGTIKLLQIQREPLKIGDRPNRRYEPTPLLIVDQLRLTAEGVIGLTPDGMTLVDAHHVRHPASRNRNNANGISLNFSTHYDRMRRRFGYRFADGCAGENILIQSEIDFTEQELGTRMIIKNVASGGTLELHDLMVAAPCTEFSNYAAGRIITGEEMRETLEFLSDGTRGFYATLAPGRDEPIIQIGDHVYCFN